MRKLSLVAVFVVLLLVSNFSGHFLTNLDADENLKTWDSASNLSKCKKKSDYDVTVTLNMIDVIVLNDDGQHITGLTRKDFEIYEDGEKQDIQSMDYINLLKEIKAPGTEAAPQVALKTETTPAKEELKTSKPRYFAFVIANLPKYHVKKNEIVNTISSFIENDMVEGDHVALYNISRSSLREHLSFTSDREKILKNLDNYIASGIYKTNSFIRNDEIKVTNQLKKTLRSVGPGGWGSMAKPHDTMLHEARSEQQEMIFTDVTQMLIHISEGMRHLKGRKNIVLVSAGLHSGSIRMTRKQALTRSLHQSFNSYNLSLYTMDVGETSHATDVSNLDPDIPLELSHTTNIGDNRNTMWMEEARTGLFQEIAEATGGDFLRKAAIGKGTFNRKLQEINYQTACYYEISYVTKEQPAPGSFHKIDVRVKSKDDANVKHRIGLLTPKDFSQMKDLERERYLTRSAAGRTPLNKLSLCTDIKYFPTKLSKALTLVSLEVPTGEILNNSKMNILASCMVYTDQDYLIKEFHKKIAVSFNKSSTLEKKGKLRYSEFLLLSPGDYMIRFYVADLNSGDMVNSEHVVTVPRFGKKGTALSAILPARDNFDVLAVNDYLPLPGREHIKIDRENPLYTDGKILIHQYPVADTARNLQRMFIVIRGYNQDDIPDLRKGLLKWHTEKVKIKDGAQTSESKPVLSRLVRIIPHSNGTLGLIYNLDIRRLTPGKYLLTASIKDKEGKRDSSVLPITIKSNRRGDGY